MAWHTQTYARSSELRLLPSSAEFSGLLSACGGCVAARRVEGCAASFVESNPTFVWLTNRALAGCRRVAVRGSALIALTHANRHRKISRVCYGLYIQV